MPMVGNTWVPAHMLARVAPRMGTEDPYQIPALDPEEHRNILRSMAGGTMSAVAGVANVLDLPGSTVRDVLGGITTGDWNKYNPLDQWWPGSWTSPQNRVTGRELLRKWGAVGRKDTWGNYFGGLALEIATDPLLPLSFGKAAVTPLAKIASRAGVMDDAAKFAARRLGRAEPSWFPLPGRRLLGPRRMRMEATADDVLKAARLKDKYIRMSGKPVGHHQLALDSMAHTELVKRFPHLAAPKGAPVKGEFKKLASLVGGPGGELGGGLFKYGIGRHAIYGKGRVSRALAEFLDRSGDVVRVSPLGQTGKLLFDAGSAAGGMNPYAQMVSKAVKAKDDRMYNAVRDFAARGRTLQDDIQKVRMNQGLNAVTDAQYRHMFELADVGLGDVPKVLDVSKYVTDPEQAARMKDMIIQYRNLMKELVAMTDQVGGKIPELMDAGLRKAGYLMTRYFPRTSGMFRRTKGGRRLARLSSFDEFNMPRQEFLRGMPEGTLPLMELADDVQFNDMVNELVELKKAFGTRRYDKAAIEAKVNDIVKYLGGDKRLGTSGIWGKGTLAQTDAYRRPGFVGPLSGERVIRYYRDGKRQVDRYREVVEWMADFTADERRLGVYMNNPIFDFQTRMIAGLHALNVDHSALEGVADLARNIQDYPLGQGRRIGELFGGPNIRLRTGDESSGALQQVWKYLKDTDRLTELGIKNTLDADAIAQVADLAVPLKYEEALKKLLPAVSNPAREIAPLQAVDSFLNWFKATQTVLFAPGAFGVRNLYGGQFANWYSGLLWNNPIKNLRLMKQVYKLTTDPDYVIKGAHKWPGIGMEWRLRGYYQGKVPVSGGRLPVDEQALDALATRTLREMFYAYDVAGPGAGVAKGITGASHAVDIRDTPRQLVRGNIDLIGDPGTQFAKTIYDPRKLVEPITSRLRGETPQYTYWPSHVRGVATPSGQEGVLTGLNKLAWGPRMRHAFAQSHPLHMGPIQLRTRNAVYAASEDPNSFFEAVNRMSPFMYAMQQGFDPSDAARQIAAAQVDYSWREFTPFEREFMTRAFPFYKWTRKMMPWTFKQVMEAPGGKLAQTMRAQNRLRGTEEYTPQRAREGMGIPLGPPDPTGQQRWLTQFDLPHEGALETLAIGGGFNENLRRTGQKLIASSHPVASTVMESIFGRHSFTGRDLDQLEGGFGAILNNFSQIRSKLTGAEHVPVDERADEILFYGAQKMIGRPLTTLRTATDWFRGPQLPREMNLQEILGSGLAQKILNLGTGLRVSNIDTQQALNYEAADAIRKALRKEPYVRVWEQPYVRKEDIPHMTQESRFLTALLKGIDKARREQQVKEEKLTGRRR